MQHSRPRRSGNDAAPRRSCQGDVAMKGRSGGAMSKCAEERVGTNSRPVESGDERGIGGKDRGEG